MIASLGIRASLKGTSSGVLAAVNDASTQMLLRPQSSFFQRRAIHCSIRSQSASLLAAAGRPGASLYHLKAPTTPAASRSLSLWPFAASQKPTSTIDERQPETQTEGGVPSLETDATANVSPEPLMSNDVLSSTAYEAQDAITHASEHVQTLAEMGQISNWANVRAVQGVMDWLVEATGMPWWLTIAAVTLSVRVLVLPLVLYGQKNAIRMANIQPRMQAHMADISHAKSTGDKQLMVRSVEAVQKLMKDNDCHPLRSFAAPLIQAPLFMTFFFALRGLGEAGLPTMKTGGLAWFSDLTMADPFYILPVVSSLTMLATLETGAEMGGVAGGQQTQQQVTMRWVMRVVLVVAIPFIAHMPASVFCYWVTNGFISLFQLWTLNRKPVRRMLNLPQPLQHSKEDLKIKQSSGQKPMGFWDAVSSGMTSQQDPTTVRVIRRDQAPSALQGLDDSRERALKRLRTPEQKKAKN